jgi:pimeloyl-ACP methyl ester carboxylesterase
MNSSFLFIMLPLFACTANAKSHNSQSIPYNVEIKPMTQENYFQDLYVKSYRPIQKSKHGFIFFHGFPGGGVRNEDLAEAIHKRSGSNCFVVHYGGLGKGKGNFSFRRSVEQSLQLVSSLVAQEKLDSVTLYGHSWGGLVAINAAAKVQSKLDKLILVSPYSMLPPKSMVREILSGYIAADPALAKVFSMEEAIEDIDFINKNYNPRSAIKNVSLKSNGTLFLQAQNDGEVPAPLSRSFVPLFSAAPDYREVGQDHSFTNREELIRTIIDWLG